MTHLTKAVAAHAAQILTGLILSAVSLDCAHANTFEIPIGDEKIDAALNTSITMGGGVRVEGRSDSLIGKSNLNPQVCSGPNGAYQACQGLFKNQLFPAQQLVAAPGAASANNDDGDLNYDKGKVFSAVTKVTSDLNLTFGDFGFFTRAMFFYDAVNENFTETHPNRITKDNYLDVGRRTSALPVGLPNNPAVLLTQPAALLTGLIAGRPWGQPTGDGGRVSYGPGGVVREKRRDGETLRQIGTDLQLMDAVFYGNLRLWDGHELTLKIGRQLVNWGESTTLVINSINQANPVNANNFNRIGKSIEEVFTPVNMVYGSFEPVTDLSVEAFYQLEWRSVETAAPGSYFSDLDIGSHNALNNINVSTGGVAEDPDMVGTPLDTPVSGLSNTTVTVRRVRDEYPRSGGQFGVALKYYFEGIGSGVQTGLYYMNYHSRLPIGSFYAAHASCARREGNPLGIDANDLLSFLATCPDIPFLHSLTHPGDSASDATDNAASLDSPRFQLEYPEDIHLFGISFNTTVGDYSIQGEVAYRPNLPLQVDLQDLGFAALGPTLTRCHERSLGCAGSAQLANLGIGFDANGNAINYGSSDFTDADGNSPYPDLISVGIGHVPGSARAFPNFVIPYRGGLVGENTPCPTNMRESDYHPGADCYIRGYEREQVYEFNLSTTRVLSPDNWFHADQIIVVGEWGAEWVPKLPPLDQLQFEAPGTYYTASAGADGSGADGSRQACSTNPSCTVGADGVRFNQHQQDLSLFPDEFSWGYRLISIFSYESVLPKISLRPILSWSHDVGGTAPGPGGNFIKGRMQADSLLETRYRDFFSVTIGYTRFMGGGSANLMRDRDYVQAYLKYQF
ncbi:DUF1302 domain-containing protein [Hydrocarboniphaga sp.]|uniref:DUF1302 domain-containing protein n=1 Tax=Hydrocarboniphaga sp. TaxID=2033016 RepID=UPI003D12B050